MAGQAALHAPPVCRLPRARARARSVSQRGCDSAAPTHPVKARIKRAYHRLKSGPVPIICRNFRRTTRELSLVMVRNGTVYALKPHTGSGQSRVREYIALVSPLIRDHSCCRGDCVTAHRATTAIANSPRVETLARCDFAACTRHRELAEDVSVLNRDSECRVRSSLELSECDLDSGGCRTKPLHPA